MYKDSEYLLMSGIQHFCFCKRQWALIHLEQQWDENVYTVGGKIDHIRCHDGNIHEKRGDVINIRGLYVTSSTLRLSGQCDVVEFHKDNKGVPINYCEGKWIPYPVEYKHGKPKENDADRLQLCAQAMALEEMLMCTVDRGALYYAETHHREEVYISEDLRMKTKQMAEEMWSYYSREYTPKSKKKKACDYCSLKNLCLPCITENKSVVAYIDMMMKEKNEKTS